MDENGRKLHIAAAVCAGGMGRRFGENKLLADALGEPVLQRTIEGVLPALKKRDVEVLLVTRHAACAGIAGDLGIKSIVTELPKKSDTVRTAVRALSDFDAILFLQGDQMLLSGKSVERLLDAFGAEPKRPARLSFGGIPASPVIFPRSYFSSLLSLSGDMGGNALLEGAEVTLVPAESGWELWDLDTREDLQRMCGILKSLSENPE